MEKTSHIRELFSHTIIYGIGIILNKSVNFFLLPVYTKYFTPAEIGMLTLIQSLTLFLGVIYTFGIETAFIKLFIDAKSVNEKKICYSSSLISLSVTSLILSSVLYILSGKISLWFNFEDLVKSRYLIELSSLYLILDNVSRFPLLLFRAQLNTKTFSLLNIITFAVNIFSNIILIVYLKLGIESIIYCYIITSFLTLVTGLIITKKYLTIGIKLSAIKELFIYGNKFIYIGLFLILIDMSDRFILKYYYNESLVGIYWANYRLATVMSLVISAFRFSWTPYFLNLKENPENKKIISSVFTYFIFAGMTLFLIITLFVNQVVKIQLFGFTLLEKSYWSGLGIIPVVLLSYLLSGIYSVLNAAPFLKDKTGSLFSFALSGLIINTIFNFVLIPLFDIYGAAFSTLITYMSMSVIIYFYSQKIYFINYEWNKISGILIMTTIIFFLGYVINFYQEFTLMTGTILNVLLLSLFIFTLDRIKAIELKKISGLWKIRM